VRHLIKAVSPQAVLIEGPAEYDSLLDLLCHPEAEPPLAVLGLPKKGSAVFYPLADFSPEWVALRDGAAGGAHVAFIDASPEEDSESGEGVAALRGERYYAESRSLAQLARHEHCRDHDELWDHLFELRGADADARRLFRDVFAWSTLARLDYEPEVLEAEGSVQRESVMAAHILRWRTQALGSLVVVTGGFHTLALAEALAVALDVTGAPPPAEENAIEEQPRRNTMLGGAWLVRYSLGQLAAQTGYGAGIAAPGYRQRVWDAPTGAAGRLGAQCLADVARTAGAAGTAEAVGAAQVIEAALQAERLAALRGHAVTGRSDLLDACTSCFSGGADAPAALRSAVAKVFNGDKEGRLPPGCPAPPIVQETRKTALDLRFNLSSGESRTTALDLRRSPNARRRSRFLWLMAFLDVGFAQRLSGPDYAAGEALSRAQEKWSYAWTPMVEAALVALVTDGATLADAARKRLRSRLADEEDERPRSDRVAEVVAQAALIGLADEFPALEQMLYEVIGQDSDLGSVLGAARRLLGLTRAAEVLDLARPQQLEALVARAVPQLVYLVGQSADVPEDAEERAVEAMIGVRELIGLLDGLSEPGFPSGVGAAELAAQLSESLDRLRRSGSAAPGVAGALMAFAEIDGTAPDGEVAARLRGLFAPGADPALAMRFFQGLMRAAPDLILHTPELFEVVDQALGDMDEPAFLAFLPELRLAFARLRPRETARLAEQVAKLSGLGAQDIATGAGDVSEADLRLGVAVEAALLESLEADGLGAWARGGGAQ
jgi:hypothetical protein